MKLRYFADMKSKNNNDFGYLRDKQFTKHYKDRGIPLSSQQQSSDGSYLHGGSMNSDVYRNQSLNSQSFKLQKNMSFGGHSMERIQEGEEKESSDDNRALLSEHSNGHQSSSSFNALPDNQSIRSDNNFIDEVNKIREELHEEEFEEEKHSNTP